MLPFFERKLEKKICYFLKFMLQKSTKFSENGQKKCPKSRMPKDFCENFMRFI